MTHGEALIDFCASAPPSARMADGPERVALIGTQRVVSQKNLARSLELTGEARGDGCLRPRFVKRYLLSKMIAANLASAFVLLAAGAVFAATDPTPPSPPPTAGPSAAAAQSPAAATATQPAAPAATQVAKKKAPSPSDIICRPDTGTGSRVGGAKICMSRADWRQRDLD
jgi:hypothetical protein